MRREILKLYVITDRKLADRRSLEKLVSQAIAGGASCVQLRDKDSTPRETLVLGRELLKILRPLDIPLIINDRADVALALGADGVHLGRDDLPVDEARRIFGKDFIIGATASTPEEVLQAQKDGADYIGLGAIYPTSTKPDHSPVIGLEGIKKARAASDIPIVATAGISVENAADVIASGADGIAVVSAVFGQKDVALAASELFKAVENGYEIRK